MINIYSKHNKTMKHECVNPGPDFGQAQQYVININLYVIYWITSGYLLVIHYSIENDE